MKEERRRPLEHFTALLLLCPVLACAFFVWKFHVDVPYWDDWGIVSLVHKLATRSVQLHDFRLQFGPQRNVLPAILLAVVAVVSHFNVSVQLLINLLVLGWTLTSCLAIARATAGWRDGYTLSASFITVLGIFSIRQTQTLLLAWALAWILTVALFAAAVALLARAQPGALTHRRLVMAAVLCFLASFSTINGFIAWFVLVPLIVSRTARQSRGRSLLVWTLSFFITVTFYLIGYARPVLPASTHELTRFGQYILMTLGGSFSGQLEIAEVAGAAQIVIIAVLLLYALRRRDLLAPFLPWLVVALFASGFSVAATMARFDRLSNTPLSSRYAATSVLLPIAIVHMTAMAARQSRSWARLHHALAGVMFVLFIIGGFQAVPQAASERAERQSGLACLMIRPYLQPSDPCLSLLFPYGSMTAELASDLEHDGVRQFSRPLTLDPLRAPSAGTVSRVAVSPGSGMAGVSGSFSRSMVRAQGVLLAFSTPGARTFAATEPLTVDRRNGGPQAWHVRVTGFQTDAFETWIADPVAGTLFNLRRASTVEPSKGAQR